MSRRVKLIVTIGVAISVTIVFALTKLTLDVTPKQLIVFFFTVLVSCCAGIAIEKRDFMAGLRGALLVAVLSATMLAVSGYLARLL